MYTVHWKSRLLCHWKAERQRVKVLKSEYHYFKAPSSSELDHVTESLSDIWLLVYLLLPTSSVKHLHALGLVETC